MKKELLKCNETYRIEKTISTTNNDKFCQAICAFSNDMPNNGKKGYLLIGVRDDGSLCGLKATDELNKNLSAIRSDGNILPLPVMSVESFSFDDGDVLVVEVTPSKLAPVRYRGRTYIRIGARKDFATIEDERILSERASKFYATFDTMPCRGASLDDIDTKSFVNDYLPLAIDQEAFSDDNRTVKEQMASLHLYDMPNDCPTYAAIILFGKNPRYFLPGNYIQFVRFNGLDNAADILNEHEFKGSLMKLLPELDTFINLSLIQKRPVPISVLREETVFNFPQWALRELVMNSVMHRDYQSNTPTKLYQYSDRVEIINAGGLYGNARPDNFPNMNDYRNPIIAEAMKYLKYVNKFNRGISRVQKELLENNNGKAQFNVDKITAFEVIVEDANNQDNNVSNSLTNRDKEEDTNKGTNIVTNKVSNKVTNKVNDGIKSLGEVDEKRIVKMLKKLSSGNSLGSKELLTIIKLTPQTSNYKIINKMLDLELISRVSDNPNAPNQKYSITEQGLDFIKGEL